MAAAVSLSTPPLTPPPARSPRLFLPADSKWKAKADSSQYQCPNGAAASQDDAHAADCLQIRGEGAQEANRRACASRPAAADAPGAPESDPAPDHLPQEENGSKAARPPAKSSSPRARRGSANTSSPPAGRTDKKQRSGSKTVSPSREGADRATAAPPGYHAEQMSK